jgi:hypothetical protein
MLYISDKSFSLYRDNMASPACQASQAEINQHIMNYEPPLERFSLELHAGASYINAIHRKFPGQNSQLINDLFLPDQPKMPPHFLAQFFGVSRTPERPEHC